MPAENGINQQSFKENLIEENIYRGYNKQKSEQVEPCRHPAQEFSTEDRSPVIQAASRGIRGGNLPHAERDHQREKTTHQPANECTARAGCIEGGIERGNTTRQDINDRKRNCEIREAAHAAGEFLGIAQF